MAAHNSPRGRPPAARKASSGPRFSTLPKPSNPRAFASRLAGSTVRTRTLPPCFTAVMAAAAAAVVVLPTPPEPQAMTISLAAISASRDVGAPSAIGRLGMGRSIPHLGGKGLCDLAGRAQPVGTGEQFGDVEERDGVDR